MELVLIKTFGGMLAKRLIDVTFALPFSEKGKIELKSEVLRAKGFRMKSSEY